MLCTERSCVVTRAVPVSRFNQLRTSAFSTCTVTQTDTDGFSVKCDCVTTHPQCGTSPAIADTVITCPSIPGTQTTPCDWTP